MATDNWRVIESRFTTEILCRPWHIFGKKIAIKREYQARAFVTGDITMTLNVAYGNHEMAFKGQGEVGGVTVREL